MKPKKRLLFIQPFLPHYRQAFFMGLKQYFDIRVVYGKKSDTLNNIDLSSIAQYVPARKIGKFEYIPCRGIIDEFKPDIVCSYLEAKSLTSLYLQWVKSKENFAMTYYAHGLRKEVGLIGYYLKKWQAKAADGVLFYTESCHAGALKIGVKNSSFCNNTIDIAEIERANQRVVESPEELKQFYKIKEKTVGIFISRFTQNKAPDLLLKIMRDIHARDHNHGFIVVGDGPFKPEMGEYEFIHDFGNVIDNNTKARLLKMADYALMPRWIGLSIIECFACGLPMITLLPDSPRIEHSVEYSYLKSGYNGQAFLTSDELVDSVVSTTKEQFLVLGLNARNDAYSLYSMEKMVSRAADYFNQCAGHCQ